MREIVPDADDEDLWHPSGWSPVYDGPVASPRQLVGFTTLQAPVERFIISLPSGREDGVMLLAGEARRVLRGAFYGWVVTDGDWRGMPDFWMA